LNEYLARGSAVCAEVQSRHVDLAARVREARDTSLATYDEALSLILSIELAQLEILRRFFDVDYRGARVMFGFSLGEIGALAASGMVELEDALRVLLAMANDAVSLAADVTLGVLFSRRGPLNGSAVQRLCHDINQEGKGVIGISASLTPNSLLLIGQADTITRLTRRLNEISDEPLHLRRNDHRWPPLHTPIVWQRNIPNRAAQLMHTVPCGAAPTPPVFSLVTSSIGYTDVTTRDIVVRWIDQPQRLWSAIDHTLSEGIDTVVHVGPQPNIIPATFHRLAVNIEAQTKNSVGMRALSGIVRRPWLQALLPKRASLLRAPNIRHVTLEDWLLTEPN
jgi:[acyl-carrier-protein] S-malonyltransferase